MAVHRRRTLAVIGVLCALMLSACTGSTSEPDRGEGVEQEPAVVGGPGDVRADVRPGERLGPYASVVQR